MKSYLTHLECTYCGETLSADEPRRLCPSCGKVLYARYDLAAARNNFDRGSLPGRAANMWRYFEVLPVVDVDNVVTLGEGFTPIHKAERLGARIGAENLLIKDEGVNPTATFKARGLSAAVSKALELGVTKVTLPSAGNAGGALAAYAARAGLEAHIYMPQDAPESTMKEVATSGAHLTLVDGLINEAGRQSREKAEKEGMFDLSTLQEPYRAEGKKTTAYEMAEQLGWTMPDAIIYPTGGGTGIVGIWKAVAEMEELGWLAGKRPKMFCVQSEGCAPMVRAFREGTEFAEPWENAHTIAGGMRVPGAIGDYLILRALRESGGGAVTVSDEELMEYVKVVDSLEGIFVCPEGAATAVGAKKLIEDGTLSPDESILLLNTGSGLKYLDLL